MESRHPFGQWMPDVFPLVNAKGLRDARNVLPVVGGYAPMLSLAEVNSFSLPEFPRGAIQGRREDGSSFFFAATNDLDGLSTHLYRLIDSGWTDVTPDAGTVGMARRRTEFAQFGTSVVAVNYVNESVGYDLSRSSSFEPLGEFVPRAAHVAEAENFLWLGDLVDGQDGVLRNAVAWGPVGNAYNWPRPGTDTATSVLSGRVIFEGAGGPVNGIVSGSEVVAIFQEGAIWRADFVGNDVVWRFDRIDPDNGLSIKGAAQRFERGIFFISEDGIRVTDMTKSTNIGKGRVNDWFFANYDSSYPDSVTITRDPKATRIWLSFASPDATDGRPDRVMVWDWVLDQFSYGEISVGALIGAGNSPASLDSPDILGDRDVLEDDLEGTDYGALSFDDRQGSAFSRTIGGFDDNLRLANMSGPPLPGFFRTGHLELAPGRRSYLGGVRPHIQGSGITMQAAPIAEDLEEPDVSDVTAAVGPEVNGLYPFRLDARYHDIRVNLGTAWSEAAYFDVEYRATGKR